MLLTSENRSYHIVKPKKPMLDQMAGTMDNACLYLCAQRPPFDWFHLIRRPLSRPASAMIVMFARQGT